MSEGLPKFETIAMGTEAQRVEALREFLGYPLQEFDREGSGFRYVRAGQDVAQARNTCPIAVEFYEELDRLSDAEIKGFLTAPAQQQRIYGHYQNQEPENTPVMYLLLPVAERVGRVAIVLPAEGKLRKSQIQTFAWDSDDLKARLGRLQLGTMLWANKITETALLSLPNADWVFYEPIKTAKELAIKLALVTRRMEQAIPAVYDKEQKTGYLHRLLDSFKSELLPSLKLFAENEKDYSFADIYAQTIAYGLFTARVFRQVRDRKEQKTIPTYFTRKDAWDCLPETNPFLRQLFKDVSEHSLDEFGDELSDGILEIFGILRAAKMDAILSDFEQKMNREDIVIRFYEDFLAAYKPKMRERRGVYYTPEPVVSYMVRSVDILIKEKFNKPLGLADPEVMILDPACGTGTFLLWIFKLIHDRFETDGEARSLIKQKLGDISWSDYVRDHLLPRVFGFELLMAPYAICHLKLGLFLEESGYQFDSHRRLGIYLTDALSNSLPDKPKIPFEEFIAKESEEASRAKANEPVMVVIGNPPYSAQSQNLSENARRLIDAYRIVDGQKIKEKGALQFEKNIQDDYIKFFRFGQSRIDQTGYGILAFISNHSYLDSPTFRGMRQSLINTFDDIFVLDLHGSIKKKECCPDGSKDENVFDVQQGVSISFLIKQNNLANIKQSKLFQQQNVWGLRDTECSNDDLAFIKTSKYSWLEKETYKTTQWNKFVPVSPFYLFIAQDNSLLSEYNLFHKITDVFPINSSGIITARDSLTIHWNQEEVWDVVNDFSGLSVDIARQKYELGKDTNDWKVELAQKDLKKYLIESNEVKLGKNLIIPIMYSNPK